VIWQSHHSRLHMPVEKFRIKKESEDKWGSGKSPEGDALQKGKSVKKRKGEKEKK